MYCFRDLGDRRRRQRVRLAAVWHAVCLSLDQTASRPSLSVVLLPLVTSVRAEAGIVALQRHLQQCRDCCAGFGKRLLLQTLHPTDDAGRASPVPALMLSSHAPADLWQACPVLARAPRAAVPSVPPERARDEG